MEKTPFVTDDARKHGLSDEDILHAYRNVVGPGFPDDEGFIMNIGPDFSGRLLEVGFVIADDGTPVIIHAMATKQIPR